MGICGKINLNDILASVDTIRVGVINMKRISVNDIKIQLKKSQKVMLIVTVLCSVHTLIWTKAFFSNDNYVDANAIYQIALMLLMSTSLFVMACLTPIHIKTNPDNLEDQQAGIVTRILALWLSISFNLVVQSVIYWFFSIISPAFTVSLLEIVLSLIGISLLAFVWVIFCTFIYLLANGSVKWYIIGFLTVNIAPMIIIDGCYDVYNKSSLTGIYNSTNLLNFNPFIVTVRILEPLENLWVIAAILAVAALVAFIYRFADKQKFINIVNGGYKFIITILISLAVGFVVCGAYTNAKLTLTKILTTIIVAVLTGVVISLITFGKKQLLKLLTVIILVAVFLSSVFICSPIINHNNEYYLPDIDDIESIEFCLQNGEQIKITDNFDEILYINRDLIELFKKGYLPQDIDSYPTRDCLANLWQDLTINYTLKNGQRVHKGYYDLIAPEFDDIFIRLVQSEAYLSSIKNSTFAWDYTRIRYQSFSGKVYCAVPPINESRQFLQAYCDELANAEKSDFYEKVEHVEIAGIYYSDAGDLFLPPSFNQTRNLLHLYYEQYKDV